MDLDRAIKMKALIDFYEDLSDNEKKMFLSYRDNNGEIVPKLNEIERKMERNKYSFLTDFLANVTGGYFVDFTLLLGSRLLKRLK